MIKKSMPDHLWLLTTYKIDIIIHGFVAIMIFIIVLLATV